MAATMENATDVAPLSAHLRGLALSDAPPPSGSHPHQQFQDSQTSFPNDTEMPDHDQAPGAPPLPAWHTLVHPEDWPADVMAAYLARIAGPDDATGPASPATFLAHWFATNINTTAMARFLSTAATFTLPRVERNNGGDGSTGRAPASGPGFLGTPAGLHDEAEREKEVPPSGHTVAEPGAVREFGRDWHAWKQDRYFLPVDGREQDRLDLQHELYCQLLGRLALAPVEGAVRVLDVATGTGIWAAQYAEQHPHASVTGSDLAAIQTRIHPPNCTFVAREDAEHDEWLFPHRFDYIHLRLVMTCFDDPLKVMRNCFDNLEAGGWVEYQDSMGGGVLTSDDGTHHGTELDRWDRLLGLGFAALGRDLLVPARYRDMLTQVGFVDVREMRFPLPINTWPEDKRHKLIGQYQRENVTAALEGISIKPLTRLGLSNAQIHEAVAGARRDLRDTRIHAYSWVVVVFGRKPPLEPGEGDGGRRNVNSPQG